jgi:DNA-binding response OmpR family regulator
VAQVLVIDDEAPIRLLCRVNLEAAGMEVREAENGLTGVAAAREERPDVILLDVMMPGMDGWAVMEDLLGDERTKDIPIIFLTARAELRDQARGLELGGVDYITKPFHPVDLAPLIEGVVARAARGESQDLRLERLAELRELLVGD